MKIQRILNGTISDLDKNENIIIPICLRNKFFYNIKTKEISKNVLEYINFALTNGSGKIIIVIVDKIQDTNFFVRYKRWNEEKALKKSLEEGKILKEKIAKLLLELKQEDNKRIALIDWAEYEKHNPENIYYTYLLYKEFKNNKIFQDNLIETVKKTVLDKEFSEEEYFRLIDYILDEFLMASSFLKYNNDTYKIMLYPDTDATVDFIHDIIEGKKNPELRKKIPFKKLIWLIIN